MTKNIHISRRVRRMRAAKMKRRRIIAGIMLSSLIITALIGINALTTVFAKDSGAYCDTVIVASGDTLWGIAAEYNTSGKDIRTVVDKIMRANNMTSTKIHIGDSINIPVI